MDAAEAAATAFLAPLQLTHLLADLPTLCTVLETSGRPALLNALKTEYGVTNLGDRQRVANALGRLKREGVFEVPAASSSSNETVGAWDFDPYVYAEVMVPPERALPGRPFRQRSMGDVGKHYVLGTPMQPPWPTTHRSIVLAAGCFWGLEKGLWRLPGMFSTAVGYCSGYTPHPTYSEVGTGLTGHTEAVLCVYDPDVLSLADILRWFWECHDPTQGMGQGADRGTQ